MQKALKIAWEVAQRLHKNSSWCKSKTILNFVGYLKNEVVELEEAILEADHIRASAYVSDSTLAKAEDHIYEELGDVIFAALRLLMYIPAKKRQAVIRGVVNKYIFRNPSIFYPAIFAAPEPLNPEQENTKFIYMKGLEREDSTRPKRHADSLCIWT